MLHFRMVLLHNFLKYAILAVVMWVLYKAITVVVSMGSNIGFSTVGESMMTIR